MIFYLFVLFLLIATVIVYRLQRDPEKTSSARDEPETQNVVSHDEEHEMLPSRSFHAVDMSESQEKTMRSEYSEHAYQNDSHLSSEVPLRKVKPPQELKAGRAFVIVLGFFGGQILGALVLGMIAALVAPQWGRELQHPDATGHVSQSFIAIASVFGVIVGAIIMLVLARKLGRHQLCDSTPTGAAWVRGSVKQLGFGVFFGLLVGCFSLFIRSWVFPVKESTQLGPLTQLAITPGVAQISWLILALFIAPPVEELLFRGIVFGGFSRSFGLIWGSIWTTSLFLLLHVPETMHHWPAIIGVCAMALAALFMRLRTQAIGPAVALHFGYNVIVASLVIIGTQG